MNQIKLRNYLKSIRESRFSSGLGCLHCGKSFNDMTNTSFSGSRYPEKWVKYIELMVEGYTLPKIAENYKYTSLPPSTGGIKF
jgi:transposase-like protein